MEMILALLVILAVALAGLRLDHRQPDLESDLTDLDDDVWDRVISEASREYLISMAAQQGIDHAGLLDNHTLIRAIQKNL